MMMNRDEYRQMLLAGSVTFPATFPQVGRLSLCAQPRPGRPSEQLEILAVEEYPSPRVTLSRRVLLASVRAVFLPRDPSTVQFSDGVWLLEDEVNCGLKQRLASGTELLYGIAFVPENQPSMLHVSAGMTAAESSQYYPPLPGDPSHNHYNPWPTSSAIGSANGSVMGSALASAMGAVPKRACSASDVGAMFMQSCSSMDPLWELERAKAMPTDFTSRQALTAVVDSESLAESCTVSHVGLAPAAILGTHSPAASCAAAQPFPTDDL